MGHPSIWGLGLCLNMGRLLRQTWSLCVVVGGTGAVVSVGVGMSPTATAALSVGSGFGVLSVQVFWCLKTRTEESEKHYSGSLTVVMVHNESNSCSKCRFTQPVGNSLTGIQMILTWLTQKWTINTFIKHFTTRHTFKIVYVTNKDLINNVFTTKKWNYSLFCYF